MSYCWRVEKATGKFAYWGHENDKPQLNTDEYEKLYTDEEKKSYLPFETREDATHKWDFENKVSIPDPVLVGFKKIRENKLKANSEIDEAKTIVDRHKFEEELEQPTTITPEKYKEWLSHYKKLLDVKLSDDPDIEIPAKPEGVISAMSVTAKPAFLKGI